MTMQTAIEPAEPAPINPHRRIKAAEVRHLCGGVSDMWIWRKQNDPAADFPKPIYIGRQRFWREAEIVSWLDAQASEAVA